MAKEAKDREKSGSMMAIALSALLALGAAGGVYYCYDAAQKSQDLLTRSKDEYKKMAQYKKAVEEYLRSNKGRPAAGPETDENLMTFLDKKSRESQIPPGIFNIAKNADSTLTNWKEGSYTVTLQGSKDAPVKKAPIVDFLRKVEGERRSTKVKSLQLAFSGDEFRSATLTFSQFLPK
jgi:hypothetical protein